MRDLPNLSTWFLRSLVGILVGGTVFYYGLVHLCLGVGLGSLGPPWLLHSGLGLLASPFLYWSLKHEVSSGGDRRPFFVTIGVVLLFGSCLLFYYAWKFGFVSLNDLRGLCITAVVATGPCMVASYYLTERVYPSPHRRRSSSGSEPARSP